jgi:hypothetical protein
MINLSIIPWTGDELNGAPCWQQQCERAFSWGAKIMQEVYCQCIGFRIFQLAWSPNSNCHTHRKDGIVQTHVWMSRWLMSWWLCSSGWTILLWFSPSCWGMFQYFSTHWEYLCDTMSAYRWWRPQYLVSWWSSPLSYGHLHMSPQWCR